MDRFRSGGSRRPFRRGGEHLARRRAAIPARRAGAPLGAGGRSGAAAISLVYPLLRDTYGIGGERGLQSPISAKWAGFAKLLSAGLDALPPGALVALCAGAALGVAFTLCEDTKWKKWTPSPTGIGIGMLVPAAAIIPMFLGGILEVAWRRANKPQAEKHLVPLASGFIAGEAIVAVVLPILVALGILALV